MTKKFAFDLIVERPEHLVLQAQTKEEADQKLASLYWHEDKWRVVKVSECPPDDDC